MFVFFFCKQFLDKNADILDCPTRIIIIGIAVKEDSYFNYGGGKLNTYIFKNIISVLLLFYDKIINECVKKERRKDFIYK